MRCWFRWKRKREKSPTKYFPTCHSPLLSSQSNHEFHLINLTGIPQVPLNWKKCLVPYWNFYSHRIHLNFIYSHMRSVCLCLWSCRLIYEHWKNYNHRWEINLNCGMFLFYFFSSSVIRYHFWVIFSHTSCGGSVRTMTCGFRFDWNVYDTTVELKRDKNFAEVVRRHQK